MNDEPLPHQKPKEVLSLRPDRINVEVSPSFWRDQMLIKVEMEIRIKRADFERLCPVVDPGWEG